MQLTKVPFADTKSFSPFFLDYIQQKESLKPFYHRFPSLSGVREQLNEKSKTFTATQRATLLDVLQQQYQGVVAMKAVQDNIQSLAKATTFTVTTGHQLNVFTGPLYFIYKIVTVINTCRQLQAAYPEYTFVPVYWMASEDHDYDEIKYFRLYGKKYTWHTNQKGAVGRFSLNDFQSLLQEVPGDISVFREAYNKSKTLSEAVRHYINTLFGTDGLVVVDGDDATLKAAFAAVMSDDILKSKTRSLVHQTNTQLEELGYKPQIFCRDINFFYLGNQLRSRIEKKNEKYEVLDTHYTFNESELQQEINEHPQRFSPNVILRPLYQEMILPNLAYVGGPAEIVYWLQLKSVFEFYDVPFPVLLPRNFAMIMEETVVRKFNKTGLTLTDIFEDKNYLFNHWVLTHSPRNLTVGEERTKLLALFDDLQQRAELVDQSLRAHVAAEGKRALNSLENIERKMLRAEKRMHADKLRQIEAVKDVLFPNGSLQERTDNFLNFYQQDENFIEKVKVLFDPFDFQFQVLMNNPA